MKTTLILAVLTVLLVPLVLAEPPTPVLEVTGYHINPGPVFSGFNFYDHSGEQIARRTFDWEFGANEYLRKWVELNQIGPEGREPGSQHIRSVRITFTRDDSLNGSRLVIDQFAVFGQTFQAEDFDRASGCTAGFVDGRTSLVCETVGNWAEYDVRMGNPNSPLFPN